MPTSLLGQPTAGIQLSLFPSALRRPRGGRATCLRVAIDFSALGPVAAKFEHVQISNRSHWSHAYLYHVTCACGVRVACDWKKASEGILRM